MNISISRLIEIGRTFAGLVFPEFFVIFLFFCYRMSSHFELTCFVLATSEQNCVLMAI